MTTGLLSPEGLKDIQVDNNEADLVILSIDANYHLDDYISICLYLLLIAITAVAGIYGPPKFDKYESTLNAKLRAGSNIYSKTISGLKPEYKTFIATATLIRNSKTNETGCVLFNYTITYTKEGNEVLQIKDQKSVDLNDVNTTVELDSMNLLNFDQVELSFIFLEVKEFSEFVLVWQVGNEYYQKFEISIRAIFFIIASITLVIYIVQICHRPISQLLVEEKYTLALFTITLVGTNPFYALYVYYPNFVLFIMNSIFDSFFTSFVYFYMLIIADYIILDSLKLRPCFYPAKVMYFVLCVIARALLVCFTEMNVVLSNSFNNDIFLYTFSIGMQAIGAIWVYVLLILAFRKDDITEKHKLYIYLIVFTIFIVSNICEPLITKYVDINNSSCFCLFFSSAYGLAFLMCFYHWPHTKEFDMVAYTEPEKNAENSNNLFESDDNGFALPTNA